MSPTKGIPYEVPGMGVQYFEDHETARDFISKYSQGRSPQDVQKINQIDALRVQANPSARLISDPSIPPVAEASNPLPAMDRAKLGFGDAEGQKRFYQQQGYEIVDNPLAPGEPLLSKDGKLYPMNLGLPRAAASIIPGILGTAGGVVGGITGGPPLAALLSGASTAGGEAINQAIGREFLGTRQNYDPDATIEAGLLGGALEAAGPLARQVGRGVTGIGKKLFGTTTQIGEEGLERAFARPQIGGYVTAGPGAREEARVAVGAQIQDLANSYKQTAGNNFAKVSQEVFNEIGDPVISLAPIKQQMRADLLEAGIDPGLTPAELAQLTPKQRLNLKTPTITTNTDELKALYAQLSGLPDEVPASIGLRLRQGISDTRFSENFINQSVKGVKSKAEGLLEKTQNSISNAYKNVDPRLGLADAEYSNSLNQYKMIKNGLKDERIESTISNMFGKNKEWQRTIIKKMQESEGGPDLLATILDLNVAEQSAPWIRPMGAVGGIGLAAGAMSMNNPALLAAAPAFSPRVVSHMVGALGKVSRSETLSMIKQMGLKTKFVRQYMERPAFRTLVLDSLKDFDSQKPPPTPLSE